MRQSIFILIHTQASKTHSRNPARGDLLELVSETKKKTSIFAGSRFLKCE